LGGRVANFSSLPFISFHSNIPINNPTRRNQIFRYLDLAAYHYLNNQDRANGKKYFITIACPSLSLKGMQKKMEKMGPRAERLQLEWISAVEGLRFKEVMEKMERLRQSVTAQEVAETKRILKDRSAVPDPELQ